ncbi:PREDICTED: ovarian-specific serine/threonine-protein kinase Lok-like [Nicrophorus vespilloides]|uniref:Ovarian-specific serine/threonine-protein kinase Lok-like n=1 Tax=Nicrophorus vespilloides TaxID=110193 RepID=A0ABM1M9M1_NICVS|nr:PREDICTED: ovarian-specific serine/threonine-protein kinase Lok-like [Nicrophorus vespilloides]
MSTALPETQTPEFLSLTPTMKNNIKPALNPWGRLYSTYIFLEPFDLVQMSFTLGRAENSDVIITADKVPVHRVTNISKVHFKIYKENGLVYITDLSKNGTFINGKLIGKGNMNILQNDDEIAIGFKGLKVYVFKTMQSDDNKYLPPELRKKYQVSRVLGTGACGEVRLVFDKETCIPYAVKKVVKGKNSASTQHMLNHPSKINAEINILRSLDHPFIISMKNIVETEECVFMVLEYMEGGELNDLILSTQRISEEQVKFLFYQILLAVQYLHSKGITHRDLKPENVLLQECKPSSMIKISDFGLSKILSDENDLMKTVCGTPSYVAPEILDRSVDAYTQKIDVWSLGVLLFYMLSQDLPFRAPERTLLNRKILNGYYEFSGDVWKTVSESAKDLVKSMLTLNPEDRISIEQIVAHEWIQKDNLTVQKVEYILFGQKETMCVDDNDSDNDDDSIIYSPRLKRSKLSESILD